jgi:hypothetical protein
MSQIVAKSIQVDVTNLNKHLVAYQKILGGTIGSICRRQAALFCQDMIAYTQPTSARGRNDGDTGAAKDRGFLNIRNSIYKIFRPIEKASKNAIADLGDYSVFRLWVKSKNTDSKVNKKKWVKFQEKNKQGNTYRYLKNIYGVEELHSSMRTDGGHGFLNSRARNGNGKKSEPFAIVKDDSILEKYIKQKQKNVGELKSPYWFAALGLGEKIKCPAWAKHPNSKNYAIAITRNTNTAKPEFTVGNLIGGRVGDDVNVKKAINHRAYSMRNQMAQKLNQKKQLLWKSCADGKLSGIAHGFQSE